MLRHFKASITKRTSNGIMQDQYVKEDNNDILTRDPNYWEDPLKFMPERFIGNELDYKGQNFEFIPFGSGRRMCPGIPLAHRVVSLMVASFVYHFDWKLPHAREEMDMNDIFGLTLLRATPLLATPIPFK
ncbi:geraniol 8-hydroxylase-like protein [Tanacetum coccineum]